MDGLNPIAVIDHQNRERREYKSTHSTKFELQGIERTVPFSQLFRAPHLLYGIPLRGEMGNEWGGRDKPFAAWILLFPPCFPDY
jgi:hypothetical protein